MNGRLDEFGERYIREGQVIQFGDLTVHQRLNIPSVGPGLGVRVQFVDYKEVPEQAICLETSRGKLVVNGQRSSGIILWAGTSPQEVDIRLTNKVHADIRIWNAWKDQKYGDIRSGVRYCGILLELEQESCWTLRCSDGVGPPDFGDLVVRIEVVD